MEANNISLDEAIRLKVELVRNIKNLLEEYTRTTGLIVERIDIGDYISINSIIVYIGLQAEIRL